MGRRVPHLPSLSFSCYSLYPRLSFRVPKMQERYRLLRRLHTSFRHSQATPSHPPFVSEKERGPGSVITNGKASIDYDTVTCVLPTLLS